MLKENSSQCQIGKEQGKILGFWLKPFTVVHEVLATVLNKCKEVGKVSDWLVEGKTILVMKYSEKNTEVRSYRPIFCLSLIFMPQAVIISDQTYEHLEENKLFPGEKTYDHLEENKRKKRKQKKVPRGDRCILQSWRKRKANLSMAWVDYKKAYNMVLNSWIITTLGMVGLADNIIGLIKQSMNKWKTN